MKINLTLTETEIKRCRKAIVDFIRLEVRNAGVDGGVMGMSGGVDSSLVATLAHKAIGDKLYALIMPEEAVTDPQDLKDAIGLAKKLGIEYRVIKIDDMVTAFLRSASEIEEKKLVLGNVKPRIRMILNYVFANLGKRLVIGTGNKTEIMLGYFTKYGDGGVDIQPIGELYKCQVRQLANYVGLPERIVKKVPTAGLWKGQTDERELGASYDMIDKVLYLFEKGFNSKETAKELNVDVTLVNKLYKRMKDSEHKRRVPKLAKLF